MINTFKSGLPPWTYPESLVKDCISYRPTINYTASYVTHLTLSFSSYQQTSLSILLQRIVRAAYLTLKRQELPIFPSDHVLHCFDAIRQHIMCHADNTPLYGLGHGIAGDGQLHQCRDWNALRDYATKNTACFRDGKPGMSFEDRFGVCDDGTDGLEERGPVLPVS